MNKTKLWDRICTGNLKNVRFAEFQSLLEALGFRLARVKGSHHIYLHDEISEKVNIQEVAGEVKPYQIRQVLKLAETYGLKVK